jgi:hypothetical protein
MNKNFFTKLEFLQMSTVCKTLDSTLSRPTLCTKAQEVALHILGLDKASEAANITTLEKLLILVVFGTLHLEDAKRFPDQNQSSAIEIVEDYELAIQVNSPFQVEALKILGSNKEALKYTNAFQISALKILGKDLVSTAWEFDNRHKLDALKFLGNDNLTLALKFDTREKVLALQSMGRNNAHLALEFTLYSQISALMSFPDTPEKALSFTSNFQTKALEIVGANNMELALQVRNSEQVTCLEQCENSSEFIPCLSGDSDPLQDSKPECT